MSGQAKVTSLDALEAFRASLIVFLAKARQSMDDVRDAVRRTRQWLENDQQLYWEAQIRVRRRQLDQATQELFSARLSEFTEKTPRQQAVRKAKAALEHAEEKLRATKKWNARFDSVTDPMLKRLDGMRKFLDDDMPKAAAFLAQAQRTLEEYAGTRAPVQPPGATPAAPSTETEGQP